MLKASGSNLYYTADTVANGRELWVSDGTSGGTHLVTNLSSDTSIVTSTAFLQMAPIAGGNLVFGALDDSGMGYEIYGASPSSAALIKDIHPTDSSYPLNLAGIGANVYFMADNGTDGWEPWVTNGTTASTVQLGDIDTAPNSGSAPGGFTANGSYVYFAASNSTGTHLYKTTATPGTISQIGANNFQATADIVSAGGKVFFSAADTVADLGTELYVTDGSSVSLVTDVNPGSTPSAPNNLRTFGNTVVFVADDGVHGSQLYRSTDTLATRLTDALTSISNITVGQTKVYFTADDGTHGAEVFVYDALTQSVNLVADIASGSGSFDPHELVTIGDKLFFVTDEDTGGGNYSEKLWWTDGTITGTEIVFTQPGLANGQLTLGGLTAVDNTLFFAGATTSDGGLPADVELMSVVVPEPATLSCVALGAMLTLRRRRR